MIFFLNNIHNRKSKIKVVTHVPENFQSTQCIEEQESCTTSTTKLDAGIKFISINSKMKPLIEPQKFRKQREEQLISLRWAKIPIR